ncbi:MAG: ThuA domain-containing protein [Rhodothermales bacterium]
MKKPIYRRKLFLFSIVPLALILAYFLFFRGESGQINALVFSSTEGFRHESIEAGTKAIKQLGDAHGFGVTATEKPEVFVESYLKDFNVVIFLNTTGDVLNDAQQIEMNRFIQAGGGFVGIHAAADTEYDWPWYGELVGGWFKSHPLDPNVREGIVQVVDAKHAGASGLPATWNKVDEWYDYKLMNPDITVLLNVDETSYKKADETPEAAPRPIAWYHEFDGGRAFYTGLGHTPESYTDPLYLSHLLGGIQYAGNDGQQVNYNNATVAPEGNRYLKQVLVNNLEEPMELELLGNDRILFVERGGAVKVHDASAGTTETIATFDVYSELEEGLLGVATDPDFANNNWIYFSYSAPDVAEIRISRFELEGNTLNFDSEKVLFTVPVQRDECCHVAGSMEFGPEGNLFVSIGDNTSPRDTGYGPIDERDGRSPWDAQKSSGNTNDLRGSIMRIKPEANGTYSIPDGNLFPKDGSGGRPEIYVKGNRNPFRIAIDQHSGFLYWGEVGPDAGEDSTSRGSRGYDEVNQAREAGFFGWPYFIGDNQAYNDHNFETEVSGDLYNHEAPINDSPNNTGARELPPAQPAFIWYPYGPSEDFPLVGSGGRNAMAGPVYYYDDYATSDAKIPEYYDGKLFIYDWMRGWIMAVTMDENGDYVRMEPFLPDMNFSNPMDMLFAPDGSLYVLEYGPAWFAGSPEAKLAHISYVKGNRRPNAEIAVEKGIGAVPLTVAFTSASEDFDGDELTYAWDFGNGQTSSEENPTFTYDTPGTYQASLTVTDPEGEESNASYEILAGNDLPALKLNITAGNGSFYWDDSELAYEVQLVDAEDGSLANGSIDPARVTLTMDYLERGADLALPVLGHEAMMDATRSLIGKHLTEASDCSGCHQQEVASVGPTYKAIADRYGDDRQAIASLAKKIIEGGAGNWGDLVMAPHPQVSMDEAEKMVEYILSAGDTKVSAPGLPLKGSYAFSEHVGKSETGSYTMIATYTDAGGQEIGPLTVRDVITLRSPKIPAWAFDESDGAQSITVPEDAPGDMGGQKVILGMHGAVVKYKNIDFKGIGRIKGNFVVAPTFTTGGEVDVYLDSVEGTLLGTMQVVQGLIDFGPTEAIINIDAMDETHDLIFVYRNEAEDGLVCIGTYLEFERAQAS